MVDKDNKGRSLISDSDLKRPGIRTLYWLMVVGLIAGALTTMLPLLWGVLNALKPVKDIFAFPPKILPEGAITGWKWDNYTEAWDKVNFPKYFLNTAVLAIGIWFFHIFPAALAGYAISKFPSRLTRILGFMFFLTLMVPFEAIMIPLYLTVKNLGLLSRGLSINLFGKWLPSKEFGWGYLAIMLPAGVNAFNMFVFKGFFDKIPNDLMEAARIDGAGEFRIFFLIILPLSRSIIAVLSIFSFMFTWNDFFWPLIVMAKSESFNIMLRLYYFSDTAVSQSVVLASLTISTIPPIILFLIFQKQIMKGITLSGLKY